MKRFPALKKIDDRNGLHQINGDLGCDTLSIFFKPHVPTCTVLPGMETQQELLPAQTQPNPTQQLIPKPIDDVAHPALPSPPPSLPRGRQYKEGSHPSS
jgi:hypothetical protein